MLALEILSMKNFMNHLLNSDTFDPFLLVEAAISTANDYTIDGHINADFFPPGERDSEHIPYELRPWSEMRGLCFELIKGRYTPLHFKFVLQLKPEYMRQILTDDAANPAQVKALVLNIRYNGGKALLTTGVSYHTFVMGREVENLWDKALCQYFDTKKIGYEKR